MVTFGAISYLVVAALYALLTILLLGVWRQQKASAILTATFVISATWAVLLAADLLGWSGSASWVIIAETTRGGAWLWFLVDLSRRANLWPHTRTLGRIAILVIVAAVTYTLVNVLSGATPQALIGAMNLGGLAMALLGLVLLEQLYRNSAKSSRDYLKLLVVGVGGIFSYDLFLYAQGILFAVNDAAVWTARGAVNILFLPAIAAAIRRSHVWGADIFVSRQVVFYTTMLTSVGVYLLLVSVGGYLLIEFGGSWGAVARVVFLSGAFVLLAILVFSVTLRRRLKVFLSKHFYRNKYDYREEWMRLVSTLADFRDSSTREVVVRAMAQIVDSPGGVLWVEHEEGGRYEQAAQYGTDLQLPAIVTDSSLTEFILKDGWLIEFEEYRDSPDMYKGLEMPDWLQGINDAWLLVPLSSRRQLIGLVLLLKPTIVPVINYEDRDLLKTAGNHIAVHIAQQISESRLAQADQFAAYNRLTAFLMHDMNNLVAQQSLIVENARRHRDNPEFVDDAFQTITQSVSRLRRIIEHLKQEPKKTATERVDLTNLLPQVVAACGDRKPIPTASTPGAPLWIRAERDRLFMALCHAVRNAQDATAADGSVNLTLEAIEGMAVITVSDTGCGMDEAFIRERLFKPFDSTKRSGGMGIGAYQIRETIKAAGGRLEVNSRPNEGSTIVMWLNVAAASEGTA